MATAGSIPVFNLNTSGMQTTPGQWAIDPAKQTVAGQLEGILKTDSPLMQQARTRAAQAQNASGLMNSSMALQSGEAAVLDKSLQIATPDAGLYADNAKFNTTESNVFARDANDRAYQGQMANFNLNANDWAADRAQDRTTDRDATLQGYTVRNNADANAFTTGRDSTLQGYTALNNRTANDYTTGRDSALQGYTVRNNADNNAAAAARDAASASAAAARDDRNNEFTLTRDDKTNAFNLAQSDKNNAFTTGRDAIANAAAADRDAAAAAVAIARDAAANASTVARDAVANTNTTERDRITTVNRQQEQARLDATNARNSFVNDMVRVQSSDMEPADKTALLQSILPGYNAIIRNSMTLLNITDESWLLKADSVPTGGSREDAMEDGDGGGRDSSGGVFQGGGSFRDRRDYYTEP